MKEMANQKVNTKVLFVCIHNTCRSVMAEAIFNSLAKRWRAESAGIEAAEKLDLIALDVIRSRGYRIEKTKPTKLENVQLEDYRLVVTVCDEAGCVNIHHPNVERWYLEDPRGKSREAYERVFDELETKVKELLKRIEDKNGVIEEIKEIKDVEDG
jgi:arsenate reductase